MTLPARRKPVKSLIQRAPKRVWPRHRAFVRRHNCSVPGCQYTDIEFAHVRSAANAGTSLKPHDWFAVSLCGFHHDEQHHGGFETFLSKYGIDLWKLAYEFSSRSTDIAMKDEMPLDRRMSA